MEKRGLIIFDVDGLLLDTEAVWLEAWEQAGRELAIPEADALFHRVVGISGADLRRVVLDELQDAARTDALIARARRTGLDMLKERLQPKKGAAGLLDRLRADGFLLAAATTTVRSSTEERLQRTGLLDRLDLCVCGDEVLHRKPDPEIDLRVLRAAGVPAGKALVLEDSAYGVEAAWRAQIRCIQIPDINPADHRTEAMAYAVAASLDEAYPLIIRAFPKAV